MKRLFLDTNILIDYLDNRMHSGTDPFVHSRWCALKRNGKIFRFPG